MSRETHNLRHVLKDNLSVALIATPIILAIVLVSWWATTGVGSWVSSWFTNGLSNAEVIERYKECEEAGYRPVPYSSLTGNITNVECFPPKENPND